MKPWHALTIEETCNTLAAMPQSCLPNQIEETEKPGWYSILLRQFSNTMIKILMRAAIISFFIGDRIDAMAIMAIVVINGGLGFIQEWKAETAINNLKKLISPRCRILRNNTVIEVDVITLVRGDCVILKAGDAVPADIRLSESINLATDESALSGESAPVVKTTDPLPEETSLHARNNMAYMGTHVVYGHGKGWVVETGINTEFGHISKLTEEIEEIQTPLQKQLGLITRQFGVFTIFIVTAVIISGILDGKSIVTMLMTGISLAISAIPEGLPAVVTITLALGALAMARMNVLVRRLQSAETLGAINVICTDKTGTLTLNEMTVHKIWTFEGEIDVTGSGYEPAGVFKKEGKVIDPHSFPALMSCLETGNTCNHAHIRQHKNGWSGIGFPDEIALKVVAAKAGIHPDRAIDLINEFPFDSDRKRMSVIEKIPLHQVAHIKGAPETLLNLCKDIVLSGETIQLTDEKRSHIINAYINFSRKRLRTLLLARKELPCNINVTESLAENQLAFLGIVGIFDPPRPEVLGALVTAKKAGIKVIVITGDSPVTAKAIADQIGLQIDRTVSGSEIREMSDEVLSELLKQNILFARTVPNDKLRIVQILQKNGQLVAMTGDGINDAPALKQADVGIAMGIRGTDVAKSAADIVLSNDNFSSIISAIREGRRQYANIRKFVLYLASSNAGEVMAILINVLTGGPLILLPIQILWINLVTDSATAISLSIERAEKNSMLEPPRSIKKPFMNNKSFLMLALFGSYIGIVSFLLYRYYLHQSREIANTVAFTAIVMMSNIHVLNFRNLYGPISQIGWLSNKRLLLAILLMLSLHLAAITTPWVQHYLHVVSLAPSDWMVVISSSLPLFIVPEIYKYLKGYR